MPTFVFFFNFGYSFFPQFFFQFSITVLNFFGFDIEIKIKIKKKLTVLIGIKNLIFNLLQSLSCGCLKYNSYGVNICTNTSVMDCNEMTFQKIRRKR